jgi:hypothetical protein
VVEDLCLFSRLYGFSLLRIDFHTHVLLLSTFPITIHALANLHERCPLGMRVAGFLVHHRMPSMKENFAMEEPLPMLSERDRHEQRKNLRRYVRKMVTLPMIAADKAGLVGGEVIDVTARGAGLRLTKPLTRGQYLTLKVDLNDGTGSVLCELVQVQWVEEDRAGVALLRMSLENEIRLRRLCGDQLASEFWD